MASEKKTYRLSTQLQVRSFLARWGVTGDGSPGVYRAKGGVRIQVSGEADGGFKVDVIPLGCVC